MKSFLLLLSIVFSLNSYCEVFISKDLEQTIDKINITKELKDLIIDSIYDASGDFTTGDDGKDCPSEIYNFKLVSQNDAVIRFSYEAQQDYVGTYGCMDIPSYCELKIIVNHVDTYTSTKCDYRL